MNGVTSQEKLPRNHGLAQILILENQLSESQASEILQVCQAKKIPFVQYVVDNKILSPLQIAMFAAQNFGTPFLDLNEFEIELSPTNLVSEQLIRQHNVLPLFKRGNHLFVGLNDPTKQLSLDEIKFHTGLHTHAIVVEADKLTHAIEEALNVKVNQSFNSLLNESALENIDISNDEEEEQKNNQFASNSLTEDAPIVKFVNKTLLDAIRKGASDIHFEAYENSYRIRLRIDGILIETATLPTNIGSRIASRLKVMSQLDISERRLPQDGRFKMNLSNKRKIDFRVNTCPTVSGEKVVMRLLDPASASLGVDALGFSLQQKENFLKVIEQPQGMILVTGPTGSGKTVTLYTALNLLNTIERNISTAEDPVEIKVQGINQVNINTKTGLTFSEVLRSFLRQDPDVIMVGEIRDLETAEIAIKAAQTGHLVLSTLHTNSAAETLTRLTNMGVAAFNIASSVSLIIAQRLARRLCQNCKKTVSIPEEALIKMGFLPEEITTFQIYHPSGCDLCTAGYKGRIGIYEVLPITKSLGEIIMSGGNSLEILTQAKKEGLITIRESALSLVKKGITSLQELNRVTKE